MAHRLNRPCVRENITQKVQLLSGQLEKLEALQKYYSRNHLLELLKKTNTQFNNITKQRKRLVSKAVVPFLHLPPYTLQHEYDKHLRKCAWIKNPAVERLKKLIRDLGSDCLTTMNWQLCAHCQVILKSDQKKAYIEDVPSDSNEDETSDSN